MQLFTREEAQIRTVDIKEIPLEIHKVRYTNESGYIIVTVAWNEHLKTLFPNLDLGYNQHTYVPNDTVGLKGNLGYVPSEGETIIGVGLTVDSESKQYGVTLSAKQLYAERLANYNANGELVMNEKFTTIDNVAKFLANVCKIRGWKETSIANLFRAFQTAKNISEFECMTTLTKAVEKGEDAFISMFANVPLTPKKREVLPLLYQEWKKNLNAQNIQSQLASFEFTASESAKLLAYFGNAVIERLTHNPYEAIAVGGIGWSKADKMAEKIGIPLNDKRRIISGVEAFYRETTSTSGNTLLNARDTYTALIEKFRLTSDEDKRLLLGYLTTEFERGVAFHLYPFIDKEGKTANYFTNDNDYKVEFFLAKCLVEMNKNGRQISPQQIDKVRDIINKKEKLRNGTLVDLDPSQHRAIETCLNAPVSILTGGAGCGKTTILKRLIECAMRLGFKIEMCSPTGKAAKRMTESVAINGVEAKTIHSLLGYRDKSSKEKTVSGQADEGSIFQHNASNPLPADWLFVDESSMTDVYLAQSLLKAMKKGARVTFIGDPNQLPSVSKGCFFFDIIDSDRFNVARLTKTHRQADGNDINDVAHAILKGSAKELKLNSRQNVIAKNYDSLLEAQKGNTKTQADVNEIISDDLVDAYQKLVKQYGIENVQVLTPVRQKNSPLSSNILNPILRSKVLYTHQTELVKGDRVIGTKNNKVFRNGEVGTVTYVDIDNKILSVLFDGEDEAKNCFEFKKNLDFAYAITCHKSQGSEYKHVLIPLSNSDIFMLDRNWLYTAVTRGKEKVYLFGQSKAITMAVRKQSTRRLTLLRYLLKGLRQVRPSQKVQGQMPIFS